MKPKIKTDYLWLPTTHLRFPWKANVTPLPTAGSSLVALRWYPTSCTSVSAKQQQIDSFYPLESWHRLCSTDWYTIPFQIDWSEAATKYLEGQKLGQENSQHTSRLLHLIATHTSKPTTLAKYQFLLSRKWWLTSYSLRTCLAVGRFREYLQESFFFFFNQRKRELNKYFKYPQVVYEHCELMTAQNTEDGETKL